MVGTRWERKLGLGLAALSGATAAVGSVRCAAAEKKGGPAHAWVRTVDGDDIEGRLSGGSLSVNVNGQVREIPWSSILSVQTVSPATARESERITADLSAVGGTDRKASEAAVAELTDIGLPAMTPLLAAYKDTDLHQPNPLYRLFARIMPGTADRLDRDLDLIRLDSGEMVRGHVEPGELVLNASSTERHLPWGKVRRVAIRRRTIERTFDVQALLHCSQIEFLDSGVALSPQSRVEESARGFVRLSFDIDGWASDPDGLKVPGPHYKTNLVDGFPFGALIGRVGPAGPRWMAGREARKEGLGAGRLYFAVNDNPHWQNNIGSFRVKLKVSDAYDLGEAQ